MAKTRTDLLQGTLELLILKCLSDRTLHGYAIGQEIGRRSDGVLLIEEGSLYPALHRLELQGWLRSEWGMSELNRRAKFYQITDVGRARLEAEERQWQRMSGAVHRVLGYA